MKKIFYLLFVIPLFMPKESFTQALTNSPVRIAVAGITHGHSSWILGGKNKTDIELVGIFEKNTDLAQRSSKQFGINSKLFYTNLEEMLDAVKPEAVVAFGSIYEHMAVVEACAPRHIHVMVEKPLAVSLEHALRMEKLAKKFGIHILTDYETSWYPTTEKTWQLLNDSNAVGNMKKAVFHHGHQGPKEIGCSKEFLEWLTDPVQNGGGALIDFGCYGANIMTYLMRGEMPVSVTAVTQHFKPAIYPKVDDEATIILSYPKTQAIIQASWNWPFGRKDMEIYGDSGYLLAKNNYDLVLKSTSMKTEKESRINEQEVGVYSDPFSYLYGVLRGQIQLKEYGLYSLQNNITVVRILEAARESARSRRTVILKKE